MLVQAFQKMPSGFFRLSYEGYVYDTGDTDDVLAHIFDFLTGEERPNRLIRPPLEINDIITLTGGPRRLRESHIVAPGTRFIKDGYRTATIPERLEYKVEQRNSGVTNHVRIPIRRAS